MPPTKKKKLAIHKISIRELGEADLGRVVGGMALQIRSNPNFGQDTADPTAQVSAQAATMMPSMDIATGVAQVIDSLTKSTTPQPGVMQRSDYTFMCR